MTGVSGSGKSTLVHDVLYAAIKRAKGGWERRVGTFRKLEGAEYITDAVLVDQAPIGRTPRSNPVTYLKAFDPIRELFAATKDARSRGLTASHFSFNVPGGRCEACQGEGEVRVEMQFLADVFVPCDQCDGKRFKPQVLEVRYRGRSIHQVLDLTVREALDVFQQLAEGAAAAAGARRDRPRLPASRPAGDDAFGRGGAADQDRGAPVVAQRRAPAVHARRADHRTAFRRHRQAADGVPEAARSGATLLVIEHNLDVIKTADCIIDLGPEGGEEGGRVVADRHSGAGRPGRGVAHRPISSYGAAEGRSHASVLGR